VLQDLVASLPEQCGLGLHDHVLAAGLPVAGMHLKNSHDAECGTFPLGGPVGFLLPRE
jgi:hypothetical protein